MGFFSELGFFLVNGKTQAQHDKEGREKHEKWLEEKRKLEENRSQVEYPKRNGWER